MRVITYTIGCYGNGVDRYYWSVPIRASRAWLREVLGKSGDIIGTKLSQKQFDSLRHRVPPHVDIVWHREFGYFLEADTTLTPPRARRPRHKSRE